jgi:hypothetical protein
MLGAHSKIIDSPSTPFTRANTQTCCALSLRPKSFKFAAFVNGGGADKTSEGLGKQLALSSHRVFRSSEGGDFG